MPRFLVLLVAATLGWVSLATAQTAPPRDGDHDGVLDGADLCPEHTGAPGAADGCPAFGVKLILVNGGDITKLAKDPARAGQAQCYYSRGDACSFTATLTLSASSAKKLKLKHRRIGSIEVAAATEQPQYGLRYGNFNWDFSPAVKRALRKAGKVTVTLAGTYTRGAAMPVTIPSTTFSSVSDPYGPGTKVIPAKPAPSD